MNVTEHRHIRRVAAIHDISGVGRCSLSVILPVLSAMGVQACPVPTAVLSTHTGGFGDVVLRDLTDYLTPCREHYMRLGLDFDAVYSGFLSSADQVDHCLEYIRSYPAALVVVDPVMGDHGKAYRTCSDLMRRRMGELVATANLITPNITEACMLLDMPYHPAPLASGEAKSLLARLAEKGPDMVVITGVNLLGGEYGNIGFDKTQNAYWKAVSEYVPAAYPGTGDIFASVVVGSLLTGDSLPMAIDRATRFVELAIKTTFSYSTDPREGVMVEAVLKWLTNQEVTGGYKPL